MLLVIDSGNTNVVFAVYDGESMLGEWRSSTRSDRTADEYGIWLTQLIHLRGLKPEDISCAVMASVVPANVFTLCGVNPTWPMTGIPLEARARI